MQNLFSLDAVSFAILLCFGVVIFVGFREVVAWYWKINEVVSLLEKIEENTRPIGKVDKKDFEVGNMG